MRAKPAGVRDAAILPLAYSAAPLKKCLHSNVTPRGLVGLHRRRPSVRFKYRCAIQYLVRWYLVVMPALALALHVLLESDGVVEL